MSQDYYLACKTHKICMFIADNKGNPFERDEWKPFYINHIVNPPGRDCEIVFCGEEDALEYSRPYADPHYVRIKDRGFPEFQDDYARDYYFVFLDNNLDDICLGYFDGKGFIDEGHKYFEGVTHWADTQKSRARDEYGRKIYDF